MLDFIFEANIANYERLLTTETDVRKIATVRNLMAEEKAKYAEWRSQDDPRQKAAE